MKSNQNTGTESLSNTNDRLRLGGHKSVGTIESEPSKSYSSDIESHRIGSSSDKAMAPPSDSVFTRQKMLSRRRTSLCNSLTGSPFLVGQWSRSRMVNVHSGASGKSSLTSRSPLAPPSNRKLNPDKNTTASKPYKGPPGNCKARADARTARGTPETPFREHDVTDDDSWETPGGGWTSEVKSSFFNWFNNCGS